MSQILLQINATINADSAGRIADDIGKMAIAFGYESYIAYGRSNKGSSSNLIRIGNKMNIATHGLYSLLFDKQGLASRQATKNFVRQIESIRPDIIHIHNLHGYYINYEILFRYINTLEVPVVWTFHDCWPFTGHCSFFDAVHCDKWQTECDACPNRAGYPRSLFVDSSKSIFRRKKKLFSSCMNLTIVTPSVWLADIVKSSFLGSKNIITIHNGVDMNIFQPATSVEAYRKYSIPQNKFIILGVAGVWSKRKGLDDFVTLSKRIDDRNIIILVGLDKQQQKDLPKNIKGISRTDNIRELAQLYAMSDVFVNPTWVDNFPTTNIESLACGTPVITYHTGGSPEALSEDTGFIVEKGDITGLLSAIDKVRELGKAAFTEKCRQRAIQFFDKEARYKDYMDLFQRIKKL